MESNSYNHTDVGDKALAAIQAALVDPIDEKVFEFESPKGGLIIADVVISLVAIMVNCIFIDAIKKIKLKLKGYRYFLINLSVTDIFSAAICIAMFCHQAISNHSQSLIIQTCGTNILRSIKFVALDNMF